MCIANIQNFEIWAPFSPFSIRKKTHVLYKFIYIILDTNILHKHAFNLVENFLKKFKFWESESVDIPPKKTHQNCNWMQNKILFTFQICAISKFGLRLAHFQKFSIVKINLSKILLK